MRVLPVQQAFDLVCTGGESADSSGSGVAGWVDPCRLAS